MLVSRKIVRNTLLASPDSETSRKDHLFQEAKHEIGQLMEEAERYDSHTTKRSAVEQNLLRTNKFLMKEGE